MLTGAALGLRCGCGRESCVPDQTIGIVLGAIGVVLVEGHVDE